MKQQATLKNISKMLNLSISTVSRALKNHPDISEETKRKVLELATIMEYEPNAHAISLRTNKSNAFGLIVPVISNYFYHSFISAVEELSRKAGYSLITLQSSDDPSIELDNIKLCRLNRVAGVFVAITPFTQNIEPFLKLIASDIPVIFFDKVPDYEACNKVCVADEEAALIAAEQIVKHRKKNILAIFGNEGLSITRKRLAAFEEYFKKNNSDGAITTVFASSPAEATQFVLDHYKNKTKPDVIFSMSDEILTGVMKGVQKLKLAVPADTGIISISNDGFIPRLYDPEITYVETSGYELGRLAFKRMMDHLDGKTFVQQLILSSRLVEGGSL
jgi:LacI family transcriptional regulator